MKTHNNQHRQLKKAVFCCLLLLLQAWASAQVECTMMLSAALSGPVKSESAAMNHVDMDHSKMKHKSMDHGSMSRNMSIQDKMTYASPAQDCCNDCSCDMNSCQSQTWLHAGKMLLSYDAQSFEINFPLAWQLNKRSNELLRPPSIT